MRTGFQGTERYVVRRILGAGGMGVVYEVFDNERGLPLALKTLRRLDPAAVYRFKREFRALARTSHPNLVQLHELVAEPGACFFTMELVQGVDFLRYVGHSTWPGADTRTGTPSMEGFDLEAPAPVRRATGIEAAPDDQTRPFAMPSHTDDLDDFAGPPITPMPSHWDSTVPRALPLPARMRSEELLANLDEQRLRHALRQLAEGVQALHHLGCLHRDIKPSNVLVDTTGRLVLLDLGLVTWINPAEASFERYVAGTAAYMSPEQAVAKPLTEATDWYSVGVMLYEAITGTRPYRGKFDEIVKAKQTHRPVPPSELAGEVPEDLEQLCMDLLRFDPNQRPDGAEILRRIGAVDAPEDSAATSAGTSALALSVSMQAPGSSFVGRDDQLAQLQAAYKRAGTDGRTVAVHLHGPSGMGKSALLRHFLDEISLGRDGAVVLSAKCYERESVPFKAVDGLIDALSRYLKSLPRGRADALLPAGIDALARIFPVLRQVEAVSNAASSRPAAPDPLEVRRRAFVALRELLGRIGSRRPLVLCVDDLQWGDLDSVHLLLDVLRPPNPPAMLLVASYRGADIETSPHLVSLRTAHRIHAAGEGSLSPLVRPGDPLATEVIDLEVGPLDHEQAADLAGRLLGEAADEDSEVRRAQAEAVAVEARGNPFFVRELVRWLRESEADLTGLTAHDGAKTSAAARVRLEAVLESRLTRLSDDARTVLETIAVAGRPLPRAILERAADLGPRTHGALDVLRGNQLVRVRTASGGEEVEPYHDRIRETLLLTMKEYRTRECHLRLALAMEGARADAEALAEHFAGAGRIVKAGEYALVAAEQAAEAVAFDRAAMLVRFAMRTMSPEEIVRRRLKVKLGDALAHAGRSAEAAAVFLECVVETEGYESLSLQARAAEEFLRSGQLDPGLAALRGVLSAVRMKLPEAPSAAIASLVLRRARLRLRGLKWRERAEEEIRPALRTRIDICWAVSTGLGMIDPIRGADYQTRGLLLALGAGEPSRIARSLAMEAVYSACQGEAGRTRARSILREAAAVAERLGAPQLRGMVAFGAAMTAYQGGEWRRARQMAEKSESIYLDYCSGVTLEIATTRHFLMLALLQLGEVGEMKLRAPAYIADADSRGDRFTSTSFRNGCMNIVWLVDDAVAAARRAVARAMEPWHGRGFLLQHYEGMYADATIDLYGGDGVRAWQRLARDWPRLKKAQLTAVEQLHLEALYLKGRTALAAATHGGADLAGDHPAAADDAELAAIELPTRSRLLAEARGCARRIARRRIGWASPLGELLVAGADAAEGKTEPAARRLEELIAALDLQDMTLYAAAARRRLAALRPASTAAAARRQADDVFLRQGIRNPPAFVRLFAPGFGPVAD